VILQSDPAWTTARLGHVTASRVSDVVAKSRDRKSWGVSRVNYAAELIAERLSGVPSESYQSAEMLRGQETEAQARAAYEFRNDVTVLPAAFVRHFCIEWAAATPDGFIGEDGLVEFKCPNTATHIDTLLGGLIPEKYRLQMQWQMACTDAAWVDFVSFDPRLPEEMRFFQARCERDAELIADLEREVTVFLGEIEETIKKLRKYAEAA
jgi:putative phage-type endonuclease